ncbi:hypothetical protein [Congregibacter litoralis]|uniref:Uncharacterized protein n=1 Tax=Congregibacter litoralis KT71 TaxID=314285 RepID=A4AD30_9GAMM|nr:hypothetical protein [Congregibacter litoralis]EAQ96083.1 hypothetical protein KT71_08505 [Congregibacter litoralis KT71]
MTLIITGHNFERGFAWGEKDPPLEPKGLFIASDSAITDSNGKTLLGGFKKVYAIPIRVWMPYFIGQHFHNYQSIHYQSECFVAIAGSTLTAQHVVNLITEHLGNLQITHFQPRDGKKEGYCVVRHCAENPLKIRPGTDAWDEGMFTDNDLTNVVEGVVIDEAIEHSINVALKSARKYKLDEDSFRQMYTELAIGYHCPSSHEHKLFAYKNKHELNEEGVYEAFAQKEEVLQGKVAVLGMAARFSDSAQQCFDEALVSRKTPAQAMFEYLNFAIDEVRSEGPSAIDRPSVLRHFQDGKLKRADFRA